MTGIRPDREVLDSLTLADRIVIDLLGILTGCAIGLLATSLAGLFLEGLVRHP